MSKLEEIQKKLERLRKEVNTALDDADVLGDLASEEGEVNLFADMNAVSVLLGAAVDVLTHDIEEVLDKEIADVEIQIGSN
ncbi:MAG: hypothetical protein P4L50_03190 [Anaerolineaceae bacterium]|nr:hypothetical protein [Anaerolineaceae bacterium]